MFPELGLLTARAGPPPGSPGLPRKAGRLGRLMGTKAWHPSCSPRVHSHQSWVRENIFLVNGASTQFKHFATHGVSFTFINSKKDIPLTHRHDFLVLCLSGRSQRSQNGSQGRKTENNRRGKWLLAHPLGLCSGGCVLTSRAFAREEARPLRCTQRVPRRARGGEEGGAWCRKGSWKALQGLLLRVPLSWTLTHSSVEAAPATGAGSTEAHRFPKKFKMQVASIA